jgi:DNA-binding XRE family transcriptional regulator
MKENNYSKEVLTRIATNVKRIRKECKMTQENLAWAADLDISTIKRIEGQKLNASVMTLCSIASVLNVDISKLFEEAV